MVLLMKPRKVNIPRKAREAVKQEQVSS